MREDIQNNIQTLLEKNIVEILELPSKYDKYKDNIIEVLDMMINYFRDIMMLKENIGKDMIINILKQNNCRLVYNIYYNFPTTTKHCNFAITADEIDRKDVSKEEFIELMLKNYNKALKIEIENGRVVDGRVEFNGRDIVLTYVLNIDKETIENMYLSININPANLTLIYKCIQLFFRKGRAGLGAEQLGAQRADAADRPNL